MKRRVDPTTVVHALGDWTGGRGPLHRRLTAALRDAIIRGDLPDGRCLPSERTLASLLAVARGTVATAYDQLEADGLVERRHGSGTWTTRPGSVERAAHDHSAGIRARRLTYRQIDPLGDTIDFGVSILLDSDGLPDDALTLTRHDLDVAASGHGYQVLGIPSLRRRIAEVYTAMGLPTSARQIAITVGAMQGIALAVGLLVETGDPVVVESPTYPGGIDTLSRAGATLIPIKVDGAGLPPADLDRAAQHTGARVAYLIPTCHNPTGSTMPEGRRRQVATIADSHDLWIIEDDSLRHLAFTAAPLPIAAYTRRARVITIGSLSKLLWGGLRLGWIRASRDVIDRIGRLKAATDLGNPTPSQLIALHALDDLDGIIEHRRHTLTARAELLHRLLRAHLPQWHATPPTGGLSMWIRLPAGSAEGLTPHAARHRVAYLPGAAASADGTHRQSLRLSFAAPPERLGDGIERLSAAWADYHASLATAADCVG